MTILHMLIIWLLIAVLSVVPLVLGAAQVRRYWSIVEMRLLLAALVGQALFQSVAAGIAFTSLSASSLARLAPLWLILFTVGNVAAVLPLAALALRMLHYRVE
jgi:hypothetical protein